jgi:hypothetical protein
MIARLCIVIIFQAFILSRNFAENRFAVSGLRFGE